MTASRIGICYCYAHDDEPLKEELDKQLSTLKRQGLIKAWHDRDIGVGEEWKRKIDTHLNNSSVILLLISASFMASDYCYSVEMKRAIERHDAGEARVIPIILRPVDWEDAPFNKLQILPTNGKPIISSSRVHQDEAFLEIVLGIKKAVKELILLSTNATPIPTSSDQRASLHIEKQPINVLLIFANPRDTEPLQLAREERAIRNAIISSRYHDQIKITSLPAATVDDLHRVLLEDTFQIIHFAGHGTIDSIIMEDEQGRSYPVPHQHLVSLFTSQALSLRCLIFTAMYTVSLGEQLSSSIPLTIAIKNAITDRGALEFSKAFYRAIGAGKSIENAYQEGCIHLAIAAPQSHGGPQLLRLER